MAGEFIILNKFLIKDLIQLGIWNDGMKNEIIKHHGSVQHIPTIPKEIKLLYRTVWELSMRDLIDMSADRNPFVCQSQSFNAWMAYPNKATVTSMHFYGWKKGLKTGMYYLRTQSAANAVAITVDKEKVKEKVKEEEITCTNEEGCIMCGS
jgi:ribonucleoside-diphosphate reductase alpha chain